MFWRCLQLPAPRAPMCRATQSANQAITYPSRCCSPLLVLSSPLCHGRPPGPPSKLASRGTRGVNSRYRESESSVQQDQLTHSMGCSCPIACWLLRVDGWSVALQPPRPVRGMPAWRRQGRPGSSGGRPLRPRGATCNDSSGGEAASPLLVPYFSNVAVRRLPALCPCLN